MLANLTDKFSQLAKTLRGEARLSEANIQATVRTVRMALLEADVALPVVKEFTAKVSAEAMGQAVIGSLNPGQAFIGVVNRTLIELMSHSDSGNRLQLNTQPPAVILFAGLQGAGKTTTAGKLAKKLKEEQKKKVLLLSCDVYRPAAILQLKTLAQQVGVDFFDSDELNALERAEAGLRYAQLHYYDVLLVDTAGRLAIDEAMMQEIAAMQQMLSPVETLFVVDAMQGQDAVNTAKAFAGVLPLTGVVLTKLDGDSRGGAALSVKAVTGAPIKFVGVSEKLDGLEQFHPDRMASRILGMGDVLSLVEDVQKQVDLKEAQKLTEKFKSGKAFDLEDFRAQIGQMKKMGGMSGFIDKLPAQLQQAAAQSKVDERKVGRMEGILNSMTALERRKPELIKASRKRRIAVGSGVPVQEVNQLLKQFEQMQTMMKTMQKGGLKGLMRSAKGMMGR
ncbi:MAG: signal recognition particle protein [Pseudomonadota bacterium]|jgi:signal recognition particle subunit SRP54